MSATAQVSTRFLRTRALAFTSLKIAAAIFLTWLVLRKVDFPRALVIATGLSAPLAASAMGLLVLQAILAAWRWMMVSRWTLAPLPFWPAQRLIMISLFYTQALPSTVPGDAARVWGGARFGGAREAAVGVFLDRLLTLLALLLLATISFGMLAARSGGDPVILMPAIILAAGLVFLALGVAARARLVLLLPGKVGLFATQAADSIHRLFTSTESFGLFALSLVIQGLAIGTMFVLARGMGLALSPMAAFIAMPVVLVAALLPLSVNGWGVREGAMVAVLACFGIGRTEAATLSVIFGLFQLVLGLVGGLFALFPDGGEGAKATASL